MDGLIRAVVQRKRLPTRQEIQQLRDHIASAPFNTQQIRAEPDIVGLTYQGRTVQRRDDSGFIHLMRRVAQRQQWIYGTTLDEYVADLHQIIRDPAATIVVYDRGRGPIVGIFAPNSIPQARLGVDALPYVYVVYAANRRSIITGYQVSALHEIDIPKDAIWLT